MPTPNCSTSVVQIIVEDPCLGNKISTRCVIHPTLLPTLGLPLVGAEPITQEQINNALVLALQVATARISVLENTIITP